MPDHSQPSVGATPSETGGKFSRYNRAFKTRKRQLQLGPSKAEGGAPVNVLQRRAGRPGKATLSEAWFETPGSILNDGAESLSKTWESRRGMKPKVGVTEVSGETNCKKKKDKATRTEYYSVNIGGGRGLRQGRRKVRRGNTEEGR